jgi:hypothetical protein
MWDGEWDGEWRRTGNWGFFGTKYWGNFSDLAKISDGNKNCTEKNLT